MDPFSADALIYRPGREPISTVQIVTDISVRKPSRIEWFCVRSGDQWSWHMAMIEHNREFYALPRSLYEGLSHNARLYLVSTCITSGGVLFSLAAAPA